MMTEQKRQYLIEIFGKERAEEIIKEQEQSRKTRNEITARFKDLDPDNKSLFGFSAPTEDYEAKLLSQQLAQGTKEKKSNYDAFWEPFMQQPPSAEEIYRKEYNRAKMEASFGVRADPDDEFKGKMNDPALKKAVMNLLELIERRGDKPVKAIERIINALTSASGSTTNGNN